jgi:ABC-type spermidine/putrescine transport system permease subunit II
MTASIHSIGICGVVGAMATGIATVAAYAARRAVVGKMRKKTS